MKLLTFYQNEQLQLGVKTTNGIVDVSAALSQVPAGYDVPQSIHAVIEGGDQALSALLFIA